ncbi:hypothetical protein [Flavobacterium sp.]|uniref:hypothetical protein n=1 Tax=Flavobacterium sp. TaxID=239 RepID=UPI0039E71DA3
MNDKLEITHPEKSYFDRIKFYLTIYFVVVAITSIFTFFRSSHHKIFIVTITSIISAIGVLIKILETKYYLKDFYFNSDKVIINYYNRSKIETLESALENIEIKLKYTPGRLNKFNCELNLKINNLSIIVNEDLDWSFKEMKLLFEFIQGQKNIKITEHERSILEHMK